MPKQDIYFFLNSNVVQNTSNIRPQGVFGQFRLNENHQKYPIVSAGFNWQGKDKYQQDLYELGDVLTKKIQQRLGINPNQPGAQQIDLGLPRLQPTNPANFLMSHYLYDADMPPEVFGSTKFNPVSGGSQAEVAVGLPSARSRKYGNYYSNDNRYRAGVTTFNPISLDPQQNPGLKNIKSHVVGLSAKQHLGPHISTVMSAGYQSPAMERTSPTGLPPGRLNFGGEARGIRAGFAYKSNRYDEHRLSKHSGKNPPAKTQRLVTLSGGHFGTDYGLRKNEVSLSVEQKTGKVKKVPFVHRFSGALTVQDIKHDPNKKTWVFGNTVPEQALPKKGIQSSGHIEYKHKNLKVTGVLDNYLGDRTTANTSGNLPDYIDPFKAVKSDNDSHSTPLYGIQQSQTQAVVVVIGANPNQEAAMQGRQRFANAKGDEKKFITALINQKIDVGQLDDDVYQKLLADYKKTKTINLSQAYLTALGITTPLPELEKGVTPEDKLKSLQEKQTTFSGAKFYAGHYQKNNPILSIDQLKAGGQFSLNQKHNGAVDWLHNRNERDGRVTAKYTYINRAPDYSSQAFGINGGFGYNTAQSRTGNPVGNLGISYAKKDPNAKKGPKDFEVDLSVNIYKKNSLPKPITPAQLEQNAEAYLNGTVPNIVPTNLGFQPPEAVKLRTVFWF